MLELINFVTSCLKKQETSKHLFDEAKWMIHLMYSIPLYMSIIVKYHLDVTYLLLHQVGVSFGQVESKIILAMNMLAFHCCFIEGVFRKQDLMLVYIIPFHKISLKLS